MRRQCREEYACRANRRAYRCRDARDAFGEGDGCGAKAHRGMLVWVPRRTNERSERLACLPWSGTVADVRDQSLALLGTAPEPKVAGEIAPVRRLPARTAA